eukprot:TRINITY_DN2607_c0_g2_i4.p1 TRINITY_DN2607_c0_g2~~TRINITY_DN2607_c0_g2_i4.p1  ORF type:complete len:363 (+),score=69.16 TRINITY_DN2607_c0_g2_i4:338-1426(+)
MDSPQNQQFINEVISFIDQPLSPTSLHRLKKSCKVHPGYRGSTASGANTEGLQSQPMIATADVGSSGALATAASPAAASPAALLPGGADAGRIMFPVGCEIEALGLQNSIEFNGLRGTVMGHQGDKVLVQFHQKDATDVFDIPPHNLRLIATVSSGILPVPEPVVAAAMMPPPPPPAALSMPPVMAPPPLPISNPQSDAINLLKQKMRCCLSQVEASRNALTTGTQLHIQSPEALYEVLQEFQPTLSRESIARNWIKVIQIYQAHAEKVDSPAANSYASPAVATSMSPVTNAPPSTSSQSPQQIVGYSTTATAPGLTADGAANLEGVINFLDAPLSPRSLKEVRKLRHSLSPRRSGRSGSGA